MSLYLVARSLLGGGTLDERIITADGPMGSKAQEAAEQYPCEPGTRLVVWGLGNFPSAFIASDVSGQVHPTERGLGG